MVILKSLCYASESIICLLLRIIVDWKLFCMLKLINCISNSMNTSSKKMTHENRLIKFVALCYEVREKKVLFVTDCTRFSYNICGKSLINCYFVHLIYVWTLNYSLPSRKNTKHLENNHQLF